MIVHVLRKPLAPGLTVAANAMAHGAGALAIDAGRVGVSGVTARSGQSDYPKKEDGTEDRSGCWARTGHDIVSVPLGRWPANLILTHLPECSRVGVKKVVGGNDPRRQDGTRYGQPSNKNTLFPASAKIQSKHIGFSDADGKETVDVWHCAEGCPVLSMDKQSGSVGASAPVLGTESSLASVGVVTGARKRVPGAFHADAGTASRFFQQVQE